MAFPFLLFAVQAAGIAMNMYQRKQQEQSSNMGAEADRRELQLQFKREQLASSEESLANTERLRDVMATQRAMYAARGQQAGQGSPVAIAARSQNLYQADERARQLSLSFRKYQTEAQQRLIAIGQKARRTERKTQDLLGFTNLLNFNTSGLNTGSKLNAKPS
jgi:hypothetical protein